MTKKEFIQKQIEKVTREDGLLDIGKYDFELLESILHQTYSEAKKTSIQRVKENGQYGCSKDKHYNKETGGHDCCGATRSWYHKKDCPLVVKEL